jgi:hypothetical protein
MSTLVLMLAAAMAVPVNGPEIVSGEMEQGLDLSGEWKAILYHPECGGAVFRGEASIVSIRDPRGPRTLTWFCVRWGSPASDGSFSWRGIPIDEGNGRFRIGDSLGIYQYDGDRLRICFGDAKRRPTSFCAGDGKALLILHRVKPRK